MLGSKSTFKEEKEYIPPTISKKEIMNMAAAFFKLNFVKKFVFSPLFH